MDGVMIVQEFWSTIFNSKKRSNNQCIVKVDTQKAYHRVNWSFLCKVMQKLGDYNEWVQWIMQCVSITTFSILINNKLLDRSHSTNGLRQGDPLSSVCFITCAEALPTLIEDEVRRNKIKGLQLEGHKPVSDIMFADNLIPLEDISKQELVAFKQVLTTCEKGLRTKNNKDKSTFYTNLDRTPLIILINAKRVFKFQVSNEDFDYLGIPILKAKPKKDNFLTLINNIQKQLNGWQAKMLSFLARLTLAKSVLYALPSFQFMCMVFPMNVLREIDRLTENFVWGPSTVNHLLKWEKATTAIHQGGLGIRSAVCSYQALLAKLS